MENKYSGRDLIMFIVLVVAVGILGYFIGVNGIFQKASVSDAVLSPTPTTSVSPIVTTFATPTPTPLVLTPTPSSTPLVSGILGSVTFDGRPVSSMEIRILDSNSNFVKTVVTDINGRFRTELSPGTYIMGPFKEPSSGTVINSSRVTVNGGYFSEINATFKRQ
ncbi:MAG TPA: carboxypeptidase-like regulatory domain-containing protein [Candidatus Paceibacterota bacterium]